MSITINLDKAKQIGHDIRRQKRAEEFAPLDEKIMKQIPGIDVAAVAPTEGDLEWPVKPQAVWNV